MDGAKRLTNPTETVSWKALGRKLIPPSMRNSLREAILNGLKQRHAEGHSGR